MNKGCSSKNIIRLIANHAGKISIRFEYTVRWVTIVTEVQKSPWESQVVLILFVLFISGFAIAGISGLAWNILSLNEFSLRFVILSFLLVVSAGAVLTYSFVSFSQNREIRHLMLLLMSANIILWTFLFLLSHPSSANWSVFFSDKDRNRTLAMALVLIIIPSILLGSFTGELKPSRPSVFLLVTWGAIIMPSISLWLFFSNDPLFTMVTSEGGIEGLTVIGGIISLGYLISQIIALPPLFHKWRKTRNSIDLSLMLALILWIIGTIFIIILWDPLQVAELVWMATIITGFILIAAVQFVTSIIHPHKILESQVFQRTQELNQSKRESDFYLSMWTHKLGNFLQGLVIYLDILEHASQNSKDDRKTRVVARDLSSEAMIVNRQVIDLMRIRERQHQVLWPVNLLQVLKEAVNSAEQMIGTENFSVEYVNLQDHTVMADNFLPLVFQSLMSFHHKNRIEDRPKFIISMETYDDSIDIIFKSHGEDVHQELKDFMESGENMNKIALDLDFFTIKLLTTRYHASIRCERNEDASENLCILGFSKHKK